MHGHGYVLGRAESLENLYPDVEDSDDDDDVDNIGERVMRHASHTIYQSRRPTTEVVEEAPREDVDYDEYEHIREAGLRVPSRKRWDKVRSTLVAVSNIRSSSAKGSSVKSTPSEEGSSSSAPSSSAVKIPPFLPGRTISVPLSDKDTEETVVPDLAPHSVHIEAPTTPRHTHMMSRKNPGVLVLRDDEPSEEKSSVSMYIIHYLHRRAAYLQQGVLESVVHLRAKGDDTEPLNVQLAPITLPHVKLGVEALQGVSFSYTEGSPHVTFEGDAHPIRHPPSFDQFFRDYRSLLRFCQQGPAKTVCYKRLKLLDQRFSMYDLIYYEREIAEQKKVPRDFYNVRKVDTHVHASSAIPRRKLLRFMREKLQTDSDRHVFRDRDGKWLTLREVFQSVGVDEDSMTVDALDVHADRATFHRFDRFNAKYNIMGCRALRDIFLKTDNDIGGEYFAEIVRDLCKDMHESKYHMAEYRLSIYGKSRDEWSKLARWAVMHGLRCPNVRWIIQIPRLFDLYKHLTSFSDYMENIFRPLIEVTVDPSLDPDLHQFLSLVVGFDSVDDESKQEPNMFRKIPRASGWRPESNPPYAYYAYYLYANIFILNELRKLQGLNTFKFRPHAGESGSIDHLVATFFVADGINHGLLLRKSPPMQYLYYLAQIGIAMSPLSNNSLFLQYPRSPLPEFFRRGLNISLSTDDPMMFHYTSEPLIEEYSVAAQVFAFSVCDLCEIARNSVIQSGFDSSWVHHVGMTNVPEMRLVFRAESIVEEVMFIFRSAQLTAPLPGVDEFMEVVESRVLPAELVAFRRIATDTRGLMSRGVTESKDLQDSELRTPISAAFPVPIIPWNPIERRRTQKRKATPISFTFIASITVFAVYHWWTFGSK
eukprot:TRINITY_DN273_c0_g1_i2.p1 TRINITY_DN273_c0_g1~~TRINITY_DN273_c0_g1_i2.p1  ORF type:complete len:900 (+),score=232.93 TRINITY_DN273_c0_g1_i2:78-2702(+)